MNTIINFLLGILITAFGYLLIPVILCISGKKYSLSKIKKIVAINGAVLWLIFNIISINASMEGTTAGVFLWSAVAYFILQKWCLYIPEEDIEETTYYYQQYSLSDTDEAPQRNHGRFFGENIRYQPSEETEVIHSAPTYIPVDTQEQQPRKSISATLVLSLLLIGSFICIIVQCVVNADLNKQIEQLEKRPEYIYRNPVGYSELCEKVEFYDEAIVFVIEGYGDYYFTYDEMIKATEDEDEITYWAYNKEQAISRGYIAYNR